MGMASTTVHGTSSSFGGSLTACRYAVCGIYQGQVKVQGREATRSRKFIQFLRKKLLYFEPTLNVFHRKRNYYKGILLALRHESDGLALLATEAALIQTVRPELNYPWVQDTMNALRIKQVRYQDFVMFVKHMRWFDVNMVLITFTSSVFLSLYRLGSEPVTLSFVAKDLQSRVLLKGL